jgi:hypothetical protein
MKRLLLLLPALIAGVTLTAQNDCGRNHPVYKVDNAQAVATVRTLGTDPEFPFLRNLSTSQQVLAALKSADNNKKYARQVKELNDMLQEAGFENGIRDVSLSSISSITMPKGTEGNLGNGHYSYSYVTLAPPKPVKAWQITSGKGCYVAILSACGNAFYPGIEAQRSATFTGYKPVCKDVAVAVSSEPTQIIMSKGGEKHITKETYIYYIDRCGCFTGCEDDSYSGEDGSRSRPLLVKTEDIAEPAAVTYKVSAKGTGIATICNGKPKEVRADMADVTVEKELEYTGEKPEVRKEYIEVSRRTYMHTLRNGNAEYNLYKCKTCK